MTRHLIAAAVSLLAAATTLLAGCATTEGTTKKDEKKSKEPTMEKMVINNVMPFDLAACAPRALDLAPATDEAVMAGLLSSLPAFQECFVDAKAVDGAKLGATVKATIGDAVTFEVTGTGVSASGKECLLAVAKKLPFKPLAAGSKPVSVELPVGPSGKSVSFGLNVANDAAGTVRLAQRSFCECYAEVGTQPAPTMGAKVMLTKDKPGEFQVEPNDGSTLSTCVLGKLQALTMPQADVQVPVMFLLVNSYATGATPDATPQLQFLQYDGIAAQRTADVMLAGGKRALAAVAYDAAGSKYKAKPTPTLIGDLRTKCAAVVSADDALIAALKGLVGAYDASLKLAQGEKAKGKDKAWEQTEQQLAPKVAFATTQLAKMEAQKTADEGACPKNK